jgi:hypothetical protein
MKRWVRNTFYVLCAVFVTAGTGYYWFIVESHVPSSAEYALDIGEVRRLASATPGDRPTAIEAEGVGLFKPPATFVIAGDGWKPSDLPVYSYRVVYPQMSVIIDTALNHTFQNQVVAAICLRSTIDALRFSARYEIQRSLWASEASARRGIEVARLQAREIQREEIRRTKNKVIASLRKPPKNHPFLSVSPDLTKSYLAKFEQDLDPYPPTQDIWLRYARPEHVDAWATFLVGAMPQCIDAMEQSIGSTNS